MVRVFVRHPVKDYATFQQGYDSHTDLRAESGVRDDAVYQDPGDPNLVLVTQDFDSVESAQAFMGSDALREAMAEVGVTGAPEIWFGEPA